MILGRSANLFLGVITAALNVAQLTHIGGFDLTTEALAAINILAGAVIALLAGSDTLAIAKGQAALTRRAKV